MRLVGAIVFACLLVPSIANAATHRKCYWSHHHCYYHRHHAKPPVPKRNPKRITHHATPQRLQVAHSSPAQKAVVRKAADSIDAASAEAKHNRLIALSMQYLGQNPTGRSHQWCAAYLDLLLRKAGYRGGGNLAVGYASYGRPVPAQVGAIAVMSHHVGLVMSVGSGYVTLISGNHGGKSGHRTVGISRYPTSRIIAYRAPT